MKPGFLLTLAGLAEMFTVDALVGPAWLFSFGVVAVAAGLVLDRRADAAALERMRTAAASRQDREAA